jgi:glycosyltransferase involved in cell wall biosynthesis
VVASDLPVLREVLGDDPRRASFVPAGDAAALAGALTARLTEPDPPGAADGRRARAARYTWRATAEATLAAYRRATA